MAGRRGNQEGSIYKTKDGKWRAALTIGRGPDGKMQRKYFQANTRREAAQRLEQAKRELGLGVSLSTTRLTTADYMAVWIESVTKTCRPSTVTGYQNHIDAYIAPALGGLLLSALDPRRIQGFINNLEPAGRRETLTANTVRHIHATLRIALGQAVRWKYIPYNPAQGIRLPKVERFVPRIPTREEVMRLLASVEGDRLEALYYLLIGTGLRQGEALGIRWSTIDLDARTVTVSHALQRIAGDYQLVAPKSASSRATLSLPNFVIEPLLAWKQTQAWEREVLGPAPPILVDGRLEPSDLVFTTAQGRPYHGTVATHRFQKQLEAAGLPKQRIYDYRHAYATMLLEEGADLREIMGQLRHTSIKLTADTYTHYRAAASRASADRIDRVFAPDAPGAAPIDAPANAPGAPEEPDDVAETA